MAAARLLLRLAGRLESVNFTQSVCGLLGAGQGPGPWHTHCSLERGQLVLSSHSFPGASERLPIQVATWNLRRRSWSVAFESCRKSVGFSCPWPRSLVSSWGCGSDGSIRLTPGPDPNKSKGGAFMWLGPDVATAVAATEDGTETPRLLQTLPSSLCATELKDDGGTQPLVLPMSTLLRTTPDLSGGQRAGQRWNQVCSQALAATSGQLKVKVLFTWSRTSRGRIGGL